MVKQRESDALSERQRAILESALLCFTEKGFAATTLEEIRQKSGASTGSIYHHFSSKEELAGALYVEGLRDYQQGLLHELGRRRSAKQGILSIVKNYLLWVEAHPDWARFLLYMPQASLVASSQEKLKEMNRAFFSGVRSWIEPHIKSGALRRLQTDLYIVLVIGPCQEFARNWLAGRTTTPLAEATRVLCEAAWLSVSNLPSQAEE